MATIQNQQRDKSFPDKKILKEFVTTKPVLQEMLRDHFKSNKKKINKHYEEWNHNENNYFKCCVKFSNEKA